MSGIAEAKVDSQLCDGGDAMRFNVKVSGRQMQVLQNPHWRGAATGTKQSLQRAHIVTGCLRQLLDRDALAQVLRMNTSALRTSSGA